MGWLSSIIGGVVGFFVGGPAGALIGAGLGATKAGERIVNSVIDFVTQPFMPNMNINQGEAARQEGVLITNIGGGDVNIPVVYGFRQVGGTVVYVETGADNNKYLWVAYALSEGPVEGIHSIEIQDEDVTTATLISKLNAGQSAEVDKTGSRYVGKTVFQFWQGTYYDDPAQSPINSANHILKEAPSWKNTHIMNGVCFLMARYEWKKATTQEEADNNPFTGNVPSIRVNLLGRKVASLTVAAAQESAAYEGTGYRERYSTNPAEILLDYLRNPRYGKGLSNTEIDWDSFRKAAAKYNQQVTYVSGVKGPILTTNYVLDTSATIMNNVKSLLTGMRSYMPYVQGKYKLRVEDAGNETDILSGSATIVAVATTKPWLRTEFAYNAIDIMSDISYTGIERGAQYSEVEVLYVSPSDKWSMQSVVYPTTEAERQSYRNQDGGRVNKASMTFATLTNYAMAYDMARLIFNKSRYQQTISFTASSAAAELEPGDNIWIEGLILDFNDEASPSNNIPWRIISIRQTSTMNFEIGCVRNPDFIYPHARAGEKDVVLAPYIPVGASIRYPYAYTDYGLYPPSSGFQLPDETTGELPNDPPTDVTDPVDQDPVLPVVDPTPPDVPPPPPLTDRITNYRVNYTVNANTVDAAITFTQPSHPQYAGIDFWWRRSPRDPWQTARNTTIAGSGQSITHTIPNLIKSGIVYNVYTRVFYSTGDSSQYTVNITLDVSGNQTQQDIYQNAVLDGLPPTDTTPAPNSRDTQISTLTMTKSLPSGDRAVAITLRQDIDYPSGLNTYVTGVNIYYKLSSATEWNKYYQAFDGSYAFGAPYTFTPAIDLGIGDADGGGSDNISLNDNFDFVFRLAYENGQTESSIQRKHTNLDVGGTGTVIMSLALTGPSENLTLVDPATAVDPRDIQLNIFSVETLLSASNSVNIFFRTPSAQDQLGLTGVRVRTRTRPFEGGYVDFTVTDYLPIYISGGPSFQWSVQNHPVDYDQEVEYIVTPLVRYAGSRLVEANTSWHAKGLVHKRQTDLDYPRDGNWFQKLNFRTIESATIPEINATPYPSGNPKAMIKSWKRVDLQSIAYTGGVASKHYFELEYNVDHVVGLTGVRIYRRANYGNNTSSSTALHYGLGRWEYVDVIPGTNATTLANGNILVNLRAPTDYQEFNPRFTGFPETQYNTLRNTGLQVYQYAGKAVLAKVTATEATSTLPERGWDYIVVVSTTSGASTLGQRLSCIATGNTQPSGLISTEVTVAEYDGYTANYLRNLTPGADGAVAAYTDNNVFIGTRLTNVYTAPTPIRGSQVI